MNRLGLLLSLLPVLACHAGDLRTHRRQPVAIVTVGEQLAVGNREAGTISFVDPVTRAVRAEIPVAKRLTALAVRTGETPELLVCDDVAHELVRVRRVGGEWSVHSRVRVARHPTSVVVEGDRAIVASSWSRRLTIVDLETNGPTETLDLSFVPGRQLVLPNGEVVVAGAFDGRLAIVDPEAPRVLRTIELPGHNVGGIAYDHATKRLLVTQPMLRDDTGTTYENVFWGGVLKNVMISITPDELARGKLDTPPDLTFLGFPSDAAGDPGAITVTPEGATLVAIAGVDTVHVRTGPTAPFESLYSGRRPAGIAITADGDLAVTCNTYDDSLTFLDLVKWEQAGELSLGPAPEPSIVERGENLFHDARISLDGWYSCHTCHTNGHTSEQRTDNLGDGYFGDPKRIPTLLGTRATGPWAWNGSSTTLPHQVKKSILKTMRGEVADDEMVAALTAYVNTLEPPPSLATAREESPSPLLARGERVFKANGCTECHAGPRMTSADLFDVGLRDKSGTTEFSPPSLLGVSQRERFLHDGRAKSLRAVFADHRHPGKTELAPADLDALLAWLRTR